MKITVLLRVPFLDRIPSLKTLVVDLAKRGADIEIVSSTTGQYPLPDLHEYPNVKMVLVKQRTRKLELPTSVKLMKAVLKSIVFRKSDYYIGGDAVACGILCKIKRVLPIRYVNFVLEYPDINNPRNLHDIEAADYVITHDHWHGDFIGKYCSLKKEKTFFLPNASYTEVHREHDDYLSRRLGIAPGKCVVLHSGGLGKWFCCKELARSAKGWDDSRVLVFHTSHHVDGDPYFKEMKEEVKGCGNILFSTTPVPNDELDKLVASAKIGIAMYSLEVLGYRAEYMGLAAGKIGNYLKCGVPVVATKVESLSYLEEYHCGVLVDSADEVEEAIAQIMADYDNYRKGAYKCYEELWHPAGYLETIYGVFNQQLLHQ